MSTLNLQVTQSIDDAVMGSITNNSGRNVIDIATMYVAGDYALGMGSFASNDENTSGCRFTAVNIPNSATIQSAALVLTAYGTRTPAGLLRCLVSAQADDSAAAFSTADGDLNTTARPRSTAYTTWTQGAYVVDIEYSISITAVIQEIIDRAGWISGNSIVLIIDTDIACALGESFEAYSYDHDATKAPKLIINFAGGGDSSNIYATIVPSPITAGLS